MTAPELKAAIRAANVTLEMLSAVTGIHYTTLSRAQNGLVLSARHQRAITKALKAASLATAERAMSLHKELSAVT
jgi:hypothetical protein